MLGAAEWSLGYAIGMGFRDLASRIFWAKMQHLGIAVVPLAAPASQWLADLRQATIEGDLKWMETLSAQIREQHPALADRLRELADNFEHDAILRLIQEARED